MAEPSFEVIDLRSTEAFLGAAQLLARGGGGPFGFGELRAIRGIGRNERVEVGPRLGLSRLQRRQAFLQQRSIGCEPLTSLQDG